MFPQAGEHLCGPTERELTPAYILGLVFLTHREKRLDSFFSSERGCVFVTSLFQNSQLRCRTFIREVGFFLRLCFPKESRVRPWGSEVAWVDLGSGQHWPGGSFSSFGFLTKQF